MQPDQSELRNAERAESVANKNAAFTSVQSIGSATTSRSDSGSKLENKPQLDPAESLINSFPPITQFCELLRHDPGKFITEFIHKPKIDHAVAPVVQKQRRLPLALLSKIKEEVERMVHDDILEPVESSEWVCNIVAAAKSNGGVRVCADLPDANKAVVADRFPLPTIEELSQFFTGSRWFSKIDLKWGYLQVRLDPSARYLTTTVTPWGLYQWKRLPFGLCSAPSCFQRIMVQMLRGCEGTRNLLDDIVVCGRTREEHDRRLLEVLRRLQLHNVTINVEKTQLSVEEVNFVGHRVSRDGIRPLHSNVSAVVSLPTPSSAEQLRRFLGAANYYRKFVKNFSELAEPLTELLRQDRQFVWSEPQQQAFEQLRKALTSPPTLSHFDDSLPTMVTCDASGIAIGAVLSQINHNNVERPVAFASRVLSSAERAYSAGEREALACIWAAEHWHWYLYGRKFTIRTDHSSLTTLLCAGSQGRKPMRLLRWAERLNEYQFDMVYRPGEQNCVADMLSRNDGGAAQVPQQQLAQSRMDSHVDEESELQIRTIFGNEALAAIDAASIAQKTAKDNELEKVQQYLHHRWPQRAQVPKQLLPYFEVRGELSSSNGIIFRGERVIVPTEQRKQVLAIAHEGHPGVIRLQQRLRDAVWWPAIDREARQHVQNCEACALSGKSIRPQMPPMTPTSFPPHAWHTIAVDIKGELKSETVGDPRYIIVAYDLFSKWPETCYTDKISSESVVSFLKSLFCRWGLPKVILSDNGRQFISTTTERFLCELGIEHRRTSLYHPQANGGVERFNRELGNALRLARAEGKTAVDGLFSCLANYRSLKHTTTGKSPAELMTGRRMSMPLDLLTRLAKPHRQVAFDLGLQDHVLKQQQRQKSNYDRRHGVKETRFQAGQHVYVRRDVRPDKATPRWTSPQRVTDVVGKSTVRLEDGRLRAYADIAPVGGAKAVMDKLDSNNINQPNGATPEPTPTSPLRSRPQREHKLPARFKDFDCSIH